MTITVDMQDFWMDEDSQSLDKALKSYVVTYVKQQIFDSIKDKVNEQIRDMLKLRIEKFMSVSMGDIIKDIAKTKIICVDGKDLLIDDYVKHQFENNRGWASPKEYIEKSAKEYADEFRKRYDYAFATAIVVNMEKNNLLREDVAKMILTD